jgi:UDP-N-acetylglucosamine 4,6-dehydratase
MREELKNDSRLRWFLGDIRDLERLKLSLHGVTHVIHAAALKQVDAGEYNPMEFVKTNVQGTQNVIDACVFNAVKKLLIISTDKASSPTSLYGATKLTADKLGIAANSYSNPQGTFISVVRFGNIIGSRGSFIPSIKKMIAEKLPIPVTDLNMSRFWMNTTDAVNFILSSLSMMKGHELFVPRIPSLDLLTLLQNLAPNNPIEIIGIRVGEKLHEEMISEDESFRTNYQDDRFVIYPKLSPEQRNNKFLKSGEAYRSNSNSLTLTPSEIQSYFA